MPALFPADSALIVGGRRSSAPVEVSTADATTAPTARAGGAGTPPRRRPGVTAERTSLLLRPVTGSRAGPADAEAVAEQGGRGTVQVVGVLAQRGGGGVGGGAGG